MRYAAFIITFRRTEILLKTIKDLCAQSQPPSKILVVDNDPEGSAQIVLNPDSSIPVLYFATGTNSGPAGGAYWGLRNLFEEGWDWVLWVDDDDAPSAPDQLETLCRLAKQSANNPTVAMVGAAGVLFDRKRWLIQRIPDVALKGVLDVDMIAGNQFPMVHRRVFEAGLLPNPDLFFGFEDLEFGTRLKDAGFRLLVDGNELLRLRHHFQKTGKEKPRGLKKAIQHLWREYYSIRTLSLMLQGQSFSKVWFRFFFRCIGKILGGFRYGRIYGQRYAIVVFKGWWDGWRGKLGMRVAPGRKYE